MFDPLGELPDLKAWRPASTAAETREPCSPTRLLPRSTNSSHCARPRSTTSRPRSTYSPTCSLLRSTIVPIWSATWRPRVRRYSLPSRALLARSSRVSLPLFGACKMPASAPTPKPAMNRGNPLILVSSAISVSPFAYASHCRADENPSPGKVKKLPTTTKTPSIPHIAGTGKDEQEWATPPPEPDVRLSMPSGHWTHTLEEVLLLPTSMADPGWP